MLKTPDYLSIAPDHVRFAPVGEVTRDQAAALVEEAILYCRQQQRRRLLADITGLTGFPPPFIGERYWIVMSWAKAGAGQVKIAMVARPEYIDPGKFGVLVARNAGLHADVFSQADESLAWLLLPR